MTDMPAGTPLSTELGRQLETPAVPPLPQMPDLVVRTHPATRTTPAVLEMDATPGGDRLAEARDLLFALRIQVIRVRAQVTPSRVARQLEIVEFDGAPVVLRRLADVQRVFARQFGATVSAEPVLPRLRKTSPKRSRSGVETVTVAKRAKR